jgi:hypothetical protein
MNAPAPARRCGKCRFAMRTPADPRAPKGATALRCRRYPPHFFMAMVQMSALDPRSMQQVPASSAVPVAENDWCGEYQQGEPVELPA